MALVSGPNDKWQQSIASLNMNRKHASVVCQIEADDFSSDPTSEVIEAVFELDYFASIKVQGKREQSVLDLLKMT